jgi:hypothetical protein
MNVIRHQAICMNKTTMLPRELAQMKHVHEAISILPEAISAVIPTLNDVNGDVGNDETRCPRHSRKTACRQSG